MRVLSSSSARREEEVRAAAAAEEDEKSGEAASRKTTLHHEQIDPSGKARARGAAPRRDVVVVILPSPSLRRAPDVALARGVSDARAKRNIKEIRRTYQPHPVAPYCVFLRKERG